jgi:hypothetical protein
MPTFIRTHKMHEKPRFSPEYIEGGDLVAKTGKTRNIHIDTITDKEMVNEAHALYDIEPDISVSKLIVRAWKLYVLVKRYRDATRSILSLEEFALDALQLYTNRKK